MNYLSVECHEYLRNVYVLRLWSEYLPATPNVFSERSLEREGLYSLCVVNKKVETEYRWSGLASVTHGTNRSTSNWTQTFSSRLDHLFASRISYLWFCLWSVIKFIYQFLNGITHFTVHAVPFQFCDFLWETEFTLFTEQLQAFKGKNIVFISK